MKAAITTHSLARAAAAPCQDAVDALVWHDTLLAVVADGVGDAQGGGEAAKKTVESFVANFKSRPGTWTLPKAFEEFARLINRTLHQESLARFERAEMLSTCAVVAVEGERLVGLNVGDSRVYHLRGGKLTRLSTDHVGEGPDHGHVLQRAMGMTPDVAPQSFEHPIAPGDVLLLCTDGVTNVLPDDELKSLLLRHATARTLVAAAREKASEETLDDMSAVVIQITQTDPHKTSGQKLEVPDTLVAGQTYDGYMLERPLNQFERAWIATRDGRQFVMKFAPREARGSELALNQFVKEIWSLTRLKADYFIPAFVPEPNRTLCYGMEYVQAPTLKECLRAGPLTVDEAVALAKFLLEAGQFLLGFDLVHADLKPENLLVLSRGPAATFKLIDFGSISEVFTVTSRAGTPSYLAPERFHAAPVSERTEIFALGVTLFESLTRAYPFGEIEPFQTPVFGAPQRPGRLNPNLPPWLETILLRALAPRPEDRYESFSEMKFELEHPLQVKPFFQKDAPLLERNPVLFYRIAFGLSLAANMYLLVRLLLRGR